MIYTLFHVPNKKFGTLIQMLQNTPAKDAYKGEHFIRWLNSSKSREAYWIVFSSKYGFIESDHPIEKYDIHITDNAAVADEMLLTQIKFYKFYGKKIKEFKRIYFIGSDLYFDKLQALFDSLGFQLTKYNIDATFSSISNIDDKSIDENIRQYLQYLKKFLVQKLVKVKELRRKSVLAKRGIYGFYDANGTLLYIGTTDNLKRRIFNNHISGNARASSLRRKLKKTLKEESQITQFLENCYLRFLPLQNVEQRLLKLIEHFFIAILVPTLND